MALHTATQADLNSFLVWMQSANAEAQQRPPRGAFQPFQFRFTLTTAMIDNADDRVRLLYFPAGIFLMDLAIYAEDDLDTHATTPALVYDIITENAAGTADSRKIISASTAGRAAGQGDRIDDAAVGVYVGDKYLVLDTTTAAATAAEGDIVLTILAARGIATDDVPSLSLDAI